jgi:D-alanyl-lipoteichoic acid acyltransferase DltB (MBOAT superfamily)
MTFTSLTFFVFFALVFILYWLLKERERQNLFLLLVSYVFYFWFDLLFGLLLIASSAADFVLARGMAGRPERRKTFLWLSLALNLGGLVLLRHFGFFAGSLQVLLNFLGLNINPQILAPLGISFFTLKKLSYCIDVYKGTEKPADHFVDYALFVAFFPQIQAGPIDRARSLLAQIRRPRSWKADWFNTAWPLLVSGLFKKIVIASGIGFYVNRIFVLDQPGSILLVWAASLAYAVQILADFSAYTDLSRGFALLLGFETPENFKRPYASLTPTEFWNRWHITLSYWLRDYIFFPLRRILLRAGSSAAPLAAILPPLAAMLVSGLWHGAGWTFLLWGAMHGLWIVIYQLLGLGGAWQPQRLWTRAAAWLAVMAFLTASWAVFRAPSLGWLWEVLTRSPLIGSQDHLVITLITLSAAGFYSLLWNSHLLLEKFQERIPILQPLFYAAAVLLTIIYTNPGLNDFIYFRF